MVNILPRSHEGTKNCWKPSCKQGDQSFDAFSRSSSGITYSFSMIKDPVHPEQSSTSRLRPYGSIDPWGVVDRRSRERRRANGRAFLRWVQVILNFSIDTATVRHSPPPRGLRFASPSSPRCQLTGNPRTQDSPNGNHLRELKLPESL